MGAGPTGSLTAIALAQKGHRVVVCDPLSAQKLQSRSRAYAITHSSRRLLSRLDLWTDLEASLAGFSALDLHDSGCSGHVYFDRRDLAASNLEQGSIGWILDHRPLMQLLLQRLHHHPSSASTLDLPHHHLQRMLWWWRPTDPNQPHDVTGTFRSGDTATGRGA